jgi:hypothetical protein
MSPHFTLAELIFSQTAIRHNIDNTPSEEIKANLRRLCGTLEQVRALTGKPISISSGYRCRALNSLTPGSSPTSAHVLGLAADINCTGMAPKALAIMIRDSGIEFDQLIYEGGWVHIGLAVGPLKHEVLSAKFSGGRVKYPIGIV